MRPCGLCFVLGGVESGFLVSVGKLQAPEVGIIAGSIVQYLHSRCGVLEVSWWGKEQAMRNVRIYNSQLSTFNGQVSVSTYDYGELAGHRHCWCLCFYYAFGRFCAHKVYPSTP